MPALFRDVRRTNPWFVHLPVVYHDFEDGVWISWPDGNDLKDPAESAWSPTEIARKLETFEMDLSMYTKLADSNMTKCNHEHRDDLIHIHMWKSAPKVEIPTVPALLPHPPNLEPLIEAELGRLEIDSIEFRTSLVKCVIFEEMKFAETTYAQDLLHGSWKHANSSLNNTTYFGFRRHHLSITGLNRAWQRFVEDDRPLSFDFKDATGSATFQQIVRRLDLLVFKGVSKVARQEQKHVSGASFDVTVARAKETSTFSTYENGSPRRQWRIGEVLVFKRPCFIDATRQTSSYASLSGSEPIRHSGQLSRVERTVINELQILCHPPLRNHRNIVHLFGICWDHTDTGSIYDACPILVQPCADLGNLEQYLTHLKLTIVPSWDLRCNIVKQILNGLHDLHCCKIIHGDIKPLNILVQTGDSEDQPVIMLSDFGFSVMSVSNQKEIDIAGMTEQFASPELFHSFHEKTFKLPTAEAFASDIYAFGLTSCGVFLGGNDLFEEIAKLQAKPISEAASGEDGIAILMSYGVATADEIMRLSKEDDSADQWLPHIASLLIRVELAEHGLRAEEHSWDWITEALLRSPSERINDLSRLLKHLERLVPTLTATSTQTM